MSDSAAAATGGTTEAPYVLLVVDPDEPDMAEVGRFAAVDDALYRYANRTTRAILSGATRRLSLTMETPEGVRVLAVTDTCPGSPDGPDAADDDTGGPE